MSSPHLGDLPANAMVLIEEASSRPLTPAQRKYNALLAKIDKQKKVLSEWQTAHEQIQTQLAGKFEPLRQSIAKEQLKLLFLLDDHLMRHKFSKKQKGQLTSLIEFLCNELVDDIDEPEFLALLDRYFPDDADADEDEPSMAEMDDHLRSEFERIFGFPIADSVDMQDPDAIARFLFEHEQRNEEEQAEQTQQQPRQKSAKQKTKEAKEQAEAEAAQDSIQSIYRQLVKALHPDRESDPEIRERKTQLMQEVTVAYEEKNFIRLLELQLAETQISHALHELSDTKIKSFIKLLDQQWQTLKFETDSIQDRYKMVFGMSPFDNLTIKRLKSNLKQDIAQLENKLNMIRRDRLLFERADIEYLKEWLKYNA